MSSEKNSTLHPSHPDQAQGARERQSCLERRWALTTKAFQPTARHPARAPAMLAAAASPVAVALGGTSMPRGPVANGVREEADHCAEVVVE